ncbi:MAG: DNA primase [Candidatus Omnitrophica bacterium]|nr:DNA primase [Candidatus Omnitrophota bacterium]
MAGRISENILEDILSRVDIVEVISGFIPLKRAGRNFRALCPFHQEKTPSFMVSPDRQIYHCFGCSESGNAFKFLMRYERLEFPEAVEILAKKAGVVLPQTNTQDSKTTSLVTQLYKINELTALFYENNLNSSWGLAAKDYLLKRGISPEVIKAFKLGLALDKWDALINYLRAKNVPLSLLEKAGLILAKEGGGYYDRFRNRIIFPIFDIKSRVVGLGARVLDDTLPKYINSPETPIYTKGRNLYGLSLAKDAIRDSDFIVVVEGYLDFIIPYQEGLKNIVASLGTALTIEQARLLKRYTHNVVMVYDADSAGELATLRSLDIFIEEEMNVKVVSLPSGFDPDSFVRKNAIDSFKEKIGEAKNLFDYKLGVLKSRYNAKEVEGKAKISQSMLETLVKFKNAVLKSEYIKKLAEDLDIREDALLEDAKKIKPDRPYLDANVTVAKKALNINPTEKLLIKLMLEENELIHQIRESLQPADFQDERISRIVSVMFDLASQGKNIEPHFLINHLGDEDISQIVCESIFLPESQDPQQKERVVNDCIRRLKSENLKLKREHLHDQIKAAQHLGDEEGLHKLIEEFNCLIKKG